MKQIYTYTPRVINHRKEIVVAFSKYALVLLTVACCFGSLFLSMTDWKGF